MFLPTVAYISIANPEVGQIIVAWIHIMENNLESGVFDGFCLYLFWEYVFFITFFRLRYSNDSNMVRYHRSLEKRFCANIFFFFKRARENH